MECVAQGAAIQAGVHINAPCGGKGTCGKCLIKVKEGDKERVQIFRGDVIAKRGPG